MGDSVRVLAIRARALIKFLTTPKKHPGAGVTTTKKLRGKPNFRRPASPSRWRRRGTTSCWAAARRCAARLGCTPRARRRGNCRSTQDCRRCGTYLATRRCCPHWQRLQERAICPHQRSLFSLLLQKFEKSSRKWRFLEESCPLPARHKHRSSRAFWPKKHPGDLNKGSPARHWTPLHVHCRESWPLHHGKLAGMGGCVFPFGVA